MSPVKNDTPTPKRGGDKSAPDNTVNDKTVNDKTVNDFPITIFVDGASSGNPGPGGWGAIIAYPDGQVEEYGGGDPQTTNNRMEMLGVINALNRLGPSPAKIVVYTDSTYVIRGITEWVWGWRHRDWKTAEGKDVVNQDLWRELMRAVAGRKIDWKHVKGHSGVAGNERVDQIAVAFSKRIRIELYRGSILKYSVPIHDVPENTGLPEMKPKLEKKTAYSYLSLIGSTPMRHTNWPSCERRVKGQPGAKFKKAMSAEEEKSILASWGVRPEQVKQG